MKKTTKSPILRGGAALLCFAAISSGFVSAQSAATESSDAPASDAPADVATETEGAPAIKTAPQKDSSKIGILPKDRSGVQLARGERNPFHQLTTVQVAKPDDKGTEENTIRTILAKLRAGGINEGSNGISVLLGDIHLKTGMEVPHVIPNQTKRLIVTGVTREFVEFAWLDKRRNALGQKFVVPIDVSPQVPFILPGQTADGNQDNPGIKTDSQWGVLPKKGTPVGEGS